MAAVRAEFQERNQAMADLYEQGRTLQEIGEQFGVTRERVRQILVHLGTAVTAVEARGARREARAEELSVQVKEFLEVHRAAIVAMSEGGAKRSDVEARYALLFPEIPAAVVREAVTEAGVLFDVDVQEFAFAQCAIEAAVWYVLARDLGLAADRARAVHEMDLDEMEGVGSLLLREGVAAETVADILGLAHAARTKVSDGAVAGEEFGIAKARYDTWRESVLDELGMESSKGSTPWPPTSQTVMKRLGGGAWAQAQRALGLTPDRRGRPPGGLVYEPQDYPAALRDFLSDAARAGTPTTYQAYEIWVRTQDRAGHRRPAPASIRLYYKSWTTAKRAATADGTVQAAPRTRRTEGGLLEAASALHDARQALERFRREVSEVRPAERSAYGQQFILAFYQEYEHRRRAWIRMMIERDDTAVARRLAGSPTRNERRLLSEDPPAVDTLLPDFVIDKLGGSDPRNTDGWIRPDAQAALDSVDDAVIRRFAAFKEARNHLMHGGVEAPKLKAALAALAADDDAFALKQTITRRVLLSWLLSGGQHRVVHLAESIPELWKQMIVGEALMATA
ncbi:sigma factor-like helix-turn-helix DNA-binding protein [Streptomyces sp. VRA16 Mangrove soil]|uniref:sigma factor-like helix-turn-helix DNA-binding protein n=1 Tax=Streptomyces sp. VRA16 Mangrove soil TaxID=2817434 RepID=UPI001A9DCEDB|nr:sigma factor-like helix-turn-helix DNA-binding protein [Streptomyces sp. VRA16 Mangrove soil]MBO1336325.1 hypothetical protein [Streptomyces sp. VRA16 Mangrove soil]